MKRCAECDDPITPNNLSRYSRTLAGTNDFKGAVVRLEDEDILCQSCIEADAVWVDEPSPFLEGGYPLEEYGEWGFPDYTPERMAWIRLNW